jgi:hypothetical protein
MGREISQFVMRSRSLGHGHTSVVLLSTATVLRELGQELRNVGEGSQTLRSMSREHEPWSSHEIVFEAATDEELARVHGRDWHFHLPRRIFWSVFTLLAFYGAWSLLREAFL